MLKLVFSATLLLASTIGAGAADPIVGKWRAPGGGIVQVQPCGGSYCATVISGQHKGKRAGRMQGSAGEYEGTVTDPRDNRTYSGSATVDGGRLELTGCALRVFCKTQVWVKV